MIERRRKSRAVKLNIINLNLNFSTLDFLFQVDDTRARISKIFLSFLILFIGIICKCNLHRRQSGVDSAGARRRFLGNLLPYLYVYLYTNLKQKSPGGQKKCTCTPQFGDNGCIPLVLPDKLQLEFGYFLWSSHNFYP